MTDAQSKVKAPELGDDALEKQLTEEKTGIWPALFAAQKEFPIIAKASENTYHHSKYADLTDVGKAILPILHKHKLMVIQPTTVRWEEAGPIVDVNTIIIHVPTDQYLSAVYSLRPSGDTPQNVGGATTYARRYGFSALVFSLAEAEDDDGNAASGVGRERKTYEPRTAPVRPSEGSTQVPPPPARAAVPPATKRPIPRLTQPPPSDRPVKLISDGQSRRMWARAATRAGQIGYAGEDISTVASQIVTMAVERYGFKLRDEVTMDIYDEVIMAVDTATDEQLLDWSAERKRAAIIDPDEPPPPSDDEVPGIYDEKGDLPF